MSAETKHPDEAFELMKFLCGGEGAVLQSRLGLAIPPLQSVAYSKDFLAPQGMTPHRAQVFLDAVKSRTPVVEDARFGHRAAATAHLINRSVREGKVFEWDRAADKEKT